MITSSTRITEDTSTLIDLLFVNKPSNFTTAKVIATSLSDHEMIFCSRKINTHKHPNRTIKCRNYRVYDHHQLQNDANNIDWSPIYRIYDVNRAVEFLQINLKTLLDKHAPLIEKRVRGKPCEWLNEDVKQKINRRDILLRRARRLKDDQSWRAYKNQRNLCNNAVRKAKSTYHRNMLEENKLSPKKFWNVIKSIFPLRSKSSAFQLKDRINEFSKYFSNVVTKMKMTA